MERGQSVTAIIEAVVQVGLEETRYLRCGRGARTVVLLANEKERLQLLLRYSADCRVIAPVMDSRSSTFADQPGLVVRWLYDVIAGLGLGSPAVVLSPALASLAPELVSCCSQPLEVILVPAPNSG